MFKLILGLLVGAMSFNAYAKPLVVPGMPGEDKLMQAVFEEMAERSNRFDGLEHYYRGGADPNTTKMIEDLDSGHMDIMYVATSESNERDMSPIFFPIYRGLLGMRIGIVRYDKSHQLGGVQSMYQLRQFKACQGKAWPDTTILEANGIPTAKSLNYPNMFPMLEGGRCDYFPRGVFEPFTEVRIHSEYNLVVDENIMLRYKMPFYFFTHKNDPDLAKHFQDILYEMFEDGTYERLFFADTQVATALEQAKLKERVILDLDNPSESAGTRNIPSEFWYNPLGVN